MKKKIVILVTGIMLLSGCTSIEKAKLSSLDPKEVIENIEIEKESLIKSHTDILAQRSFLIGELRLNRAKKDFINNEPKKDVLSILSESKAYFNKAKLEAKTRAIIPVYILAARQDAIDNKIYTNNRLMNKLYDIDESLIDETDNFRLNLSTEALSNFQKKYQLLEIEAMQNLRLGVFKKIIKKAEKQNAQDLAPLTLINAKSAINYSENLISQSVLDPSYYKISIIQANKSVKLLYDVMEKLTNEAKGSSEKTALKLVYQERELGKLSSEISFLQSSLLDHNYQIGAMNEDIRNKNSQIESTENKINFQLAMDKVRKVFDEDEANVYQQGDKLIIRIRKINFKSGSASIPSNSMSLLSKVNSAITDLEPSEVIIQGHTDSSGYAANNMMLSNKRARAVKKYFSSLNAKYPMDARGYGETKPIANNQTKTGKLLNRRVDIIVKGTY